MKKVEDIDIWRSASVLLKSRGCEAFAVASGRASDLAGQGDDEGAEVWCRIARVIELLEVEAKDNHAPKGI
jgi:hypothetical protein